MFESYFRIILIGFLSLAGVAPLNGATLDVPGAFPTIGEALHSAQPTDIIAVAPGRYRERLRLTQPLTIRGVGVPGEVVIDGEGIGHVIEITSSDVNVIGVSLRRSGEAIDRSHSCIYVHQQARNVRLLENRLSECAFGIWVNGSHGVHIEGNVISGYKKPVFSDRGNGINLWNARGAQVKVNRVRDVRDGIYLSVTNESTIESNVMTDVRFGIHYMYNDNNHVVGNVTCDSMVGLAMMFSKRLIIRDNVAVRNREHGILLRSIYDSKIDNNIAISNNKGMFINDSSYNEITKSWIENNAIGVHLTAGSEENQVFSNNFVDNPVQVQFSWRYPQYWDNNFWSDYLGWDFDGDRFGDRIYHASNRVDSLVFEYPELKLLASSPVVQLLQALESRFPVFRTASVIDRHPLMQPFRSAVQATAVGTEFCT